MIFYSSHSSVNANDNDFFHCFYFSFFFFVVLRWHSLVAAIPYGMRPMAKFEEKRSENRDQKSVANFISTFFYVFQWQPTATATTANALYQIMKVNFVPNYGLMCDVWFVAVPSPLLLLPLLLSSRVRIFQFVSAAHIWACKVVRARCCWFFAFVVVVVSFVKMCIHAFEHVSCQITSYIVVSIHTMPKCMKPNAESI